MTVSNPTVRLRWLVVAAAVLFTLALLSRPYTSFLYVVVCGIATFLFIPFIKYEVIPFIRLLTRKPALVGLLFILLLALLPIYFVDTVRYKLALEEGAEDAALSKRLQYLYCQKYSLRLSFDAPNNTFKGTQNILLHGKVPVHTPRARAAVIKDGISPVRKGEILSYRDWKSVEERNVVAYMLLSAGMDGWKVEDIDTDVKLEREEHSADPNDPGIPTVEVKALLSTDKADVSTNKEGLVTYISEVKIPRVVFEEPLLSDPKVEIVVAAPKNTYINHNLNGTFSETVLESNEPGQKLIADKVVDQAGVIRFNYPSYIFQNRVMSNLISFSWWWAALLSVLSALTGVIGFFCAVFLDVIKDETLKPKARRMLRAFKLIPQE